jgi:hypothetical protein
MQTQNVPNRITVTKHLPAGKVLLVDGIPFPIEKDCDIVISGEDITEYYDPHQIADSGGVMVESYSIRCEAIKLNSPALDMAITREDKQMKYKKTCTDIGGHYLLLVEPKQEGNALHTLIETICFCHNGFGDGYYTLRFLEGAHIR